MVLSVFLPFFIHIIRFQYVASTGNVVEVVCIRCVDGSVVRGADYRPKGPWFESLT